MHVILLSTLQEKKNVIESVYYNEWQKNLPGQLLVNVE